MTVNRSCQPRAGTLAARLAMEHGAGRGVYLDILPPRPPRPFRWLNVAALWRSRNDRVARLLGDPTNELRRRWMAWLREQGRTTENPVVDAFADRERVTFVVIGDTGEGDVSQWVCVPPLLAIKDECDFAVICSDVIYPTGDVNDYPAKFYAPYASWDKPILGLPGNHDWYDELNGFMYHLCGVDLPPDDFAEVRRPPLWRPPRERGAAAEAARRSRPPRRMDQPAPYFLLDAGPIALVCIDTGIRGDLDAEQGRWLVRVSKEVRKPKVLLTGKPLIVDGGYEPGVIAGQDRTVDDIVRDPAHGYVAAIGGDIHNYQRYPVQVDERRCIEYIVAGGGGAFMHATHRIGRVALGNVTEEQFRCFPLRGDSLCLYAATLVPALRRLVLLAAVVPFVVLAAAVGAGLLFDELFAGGAWPWIAAGVLFSLPLVASAAAWQQVSASGAPGVLGLETKLTPQQASTWMGQRLNEAPTVAAPVDIGPKQQELMEFVAPRLHHTRGIFHEFFSEIFDVDSPPLYKQFLRLDADEHRLRITCCAAIGTETAGQPPLVEEWVEIELDPVRAALANRVLA